MAQKDNKTNKTQEAFIKSLLIRCKNEKEEPWQMPEMVGFYNEAALPAAPVQTAEEATRASVRKVVCSPDLPMPSYSPEKPVEPAPSIQCPICHKMYNTESAFKTHQRTAHTPAARPAAARPRDTEDPYRCNICSKTFAVPARLTRHYRTHTGEKPFRCEFCNKSFSVKENLSVHRRIHTKERPYRCDVCERAFEHSGKLHRHMRIHTGERPHKCSVCEKTFIQSGQLVIHMRTHTGEKPYVCTVCQKGFTCSKQLKVHSRTHTGEKPYSCEICGKSFGYNHVLKLHQVAHYGEKVYKCTICNDTFNSKKSMEAHIKSHSEGAPPTPPTSSTSSESSCSSSASDKENKDSLPQDLSRYESEVRYCIYERDPLALSPPYVPQYAGAGVELLAAAAAAATEHPDVYIIARNHPDVVLRHPAYFTAPTVQYSPLTAGDDIRRRVEAALAVDEMPSEEETLTPPSSNPVSPAPSPDPELSLPPRKRSKMILKSMEASIDLSPVRYSSVIHYARAS